MAIRRYIPQEEEQRQESVPGKNRGPGRPKEDRRGKKKSRDDERRADAFEYYWGLGEIRSYAKVAKKFEVAGITVQKWADKFKWQRRINERLRKAGKQRDDEAVKDVVATKIMVKRKVDRLIEDFFDDLHDRALKGQSMPIIRNMDDLERIISLALKMVGGDGLEGSGPAGGNGVTLEKVMTERIIGNPEAVRKLEELYRAAYSDPMADTRPALVMDVVDGEDDDL